MTRTHPAALPEDKLLADCDVRRERVRGPGGQHRNKVETAVVVIHRPTGIRASACERRSQAENRKNAIIRLRVRLAVQVRSAESSRPKGPSDLWLSRCADKPIRVSTEHGDYPALLAEALDAVDAAQFDVSLAAKRLDVTTSQLVRFLQGEPEAWQLVQSQRRQRGLRPLA